MSVLSLLMDPGAWAALVTLSVLEIVQSLSSAGLETDFQRGHSAISAMWGLLGLTLLYLGLTRRPSLGSRNTKLGARDRSGCRSLFSSGSRCWVGSPGSWA